MRRWEEYDFYEKYESVPYNIIKLIGKVTI